MLSVAEAKEKLLSNLPLVDTVEIGLEDSLGRVLAEPIVAKMDSPSFTNSSMDGFAVRAEDVAGVSGEDNVTLSIVGDIPAGIVPEKAIGNVNVSYYFGQ